MNNKNVLSNWLFSGPDGTIKNLQVYRVIYVLYIFIIMMPHQLWIQDYPDTFFFPRIGITLFFTGFPSITFFYVLNFLLTVALLALLFGYKKFYASIAVGLLLFIGNSWSYSFGKINHDIFIVIIPLIFAVIFWKGKSYETYQWITPIFALLIGLAMFTAAFAKITTGWLDPNVSAITGHLLQNYYTTGRETLWGSMLLSINSFHLFKFLDYSTIILESAFILSIFSLKYFRLVCAMACFFHFGIQLTMGISFTPNIIAYAFFVDWSSLYNVEALKNSLQKISSYRIGLGGLCLIALPLCAIYILFGNPFLINLGSGFIKIFGGNLAQTIIIVIAVCISLAYIWKLLPWYHQKKVTVLQYKI
ncbi:hypothetical protein [Fodinibius salsisoli]|uniref:Vitamin K-dependent gamma-carboxylase n=1 Tax=Fodinibius salsisoli TaxID=2820877 RepID=A0ABT3PM00_9BACT|nr:hypothetical protein [Fodinibius salsisoli]MCW9706748.1 hypothetical protein [Fodinibius salsisoli]